MGSEVPPDFIQFTDHEQNPSRFVPALASLVWDQYILLIKIEGFTRCCDQVVQSTKLNVLRYKL
jgi:hypothetical protein